MAGVFEHLMQAMTAEAAARGQVDLDLVSVDSATVRAHHHAAGMVLGGELARALDEAVEQERGLRQRGKSLKTANPATAGTAPGIRVETDGCGYGADFG